MSRNQIKVCFFLHVTATLLHRELIIWDTLQATSFGTYTGPEILTFKMFLGWYFIKRDSSDTLVEFLVAPGLYDILEFAH